MLKNSYCLILLKDIDRWEQRPLDRESAESGIYGARQLLTSQKMQMKHDCVAESHQRIIYFQAAISD